MTPLTLIATGVPRADAASLWRVFQAKGTGKSMTMTFFVRHEVQTPLSMKDIGACATSYAQHVHCSCRSACNNALTFDFTGLTVTEHSEN